MANAAVANARAALAVVRLCQAINKIYHKRVPCEARGIGRRRQMRVARVAPDDLEQLRDLLRQRRDLRFELNDPGLPRCQRALQLSDSIVAPVRRHDHPIADPHPNGKCEKKDGAIWTTYAGPERLRREHLRTEQLPLVARQAGCRVVERMREL